MSIGEFTLALVTFLLDSYDVEKPAINSIFTLKILEINYTAYEIERPVKM